MGSIIKNHNKKILNNNTTSQNGCNCRKKDQCPLDNNCLIASVIYKANVTTDKDNTGKNYIRLTEGTFKQRYTQHKLTLWNRKYANRTELAKHPPVSLSAWFTPLSPQNLDGAKMSLRFCSTDEFLNKRCVEYKGYLKSQGYNADLVDNQFDRALSIERSELLKKKYSR